MSCKSCKKNNFIPVVNTAISRYSYQSSRGLKTSTTPLKFRCSQALTHVQLICQKLINSYSVVEGFVQNLDILNIPPPNNDYDYTYQIVKSGNNFVIVEGRPTDPENSVVTGIVYLMKSLNNNTLIPVKDVKISNNLDFNDVKIEDVVYTKRLKFLESGWNIKC